MTLSDKVSKRVEASLKDKLAKHREKVGDDPRKQTTLRKLKICFNRGVGAYKTNPGSVRPSVKSADQWAHARVNSFLYALRNLRFRSGKHDQDLLPSGHPAKAKEASALQESYKPTEGMVEEAKRGLAWRREHGRGGTAVGIARARDIVSGKNLSAQTVKRMFSFFSRHEVDKRAEGFRPGGDGYPSNGRIAWALWGGDPGFSWSRQIVERLKKLEEEKMPIPVPNAGESKEEFIDRCMMDDVMVKEYDSDQRRAICETQASYQDEPVERKEELSRNEQRISFQRKPKRRGRYSIDQTKGAMTSVSLIQIGEAKGHGMFIDEESLESALDVLGENLPAYVTHEGAIESDRLLKEVGVFSGFFIEEGKLKAESFKALSSFREDEPERFRRLFDLAESMPDAFGLSLVFEPELVWIMEDGTELPIDKGSAKNAIRDLPSVRFKSIRSADFVDAPAANEGGLFSANSQTGEKLMDEETNNEDEKVVEFDEQATDQEVEEQTEQNEVDPIDALKAEIEELKATINGLNLQVEELTGKLSDANDENAKLSASVKGEEVLAEGDADVSDNSTQDVVEKFQAANGAEAQNIWKQYKHEIIASLRRD